ncbi:hypothetical protein ZIOFF_034932 [Zingiber officinale]|uniref:Uncharacterized protein n=1 Tax=Zingiber officinale TaxID=94328 RepID=A0A8J5L6P7_ZINOF|nr:hypothetical protein ZIOFF_034932 [Zingiber officinale]
MRRHGGISPSCKMTKILMVCVMDAFLAGANYVKASNFLGFLPQVIWNALSCWDDQEMLQHALSGFGGPLCFVLPWFFGVKANMCHACEEFQISLASTAYAYAIFQIFKWNFWKTYFVLLHPRLSKQDAELLSTPQVVQARAMLLQKLQNQTQVGFTKTGRCLRLPDDKAAKRPFNKFNVASNLSVEATDDDDRKMRLVLLLQGSSSSLLVRMRLIVISRKKTNNMLLKLRKDESGFYHVEIAWKGLDYALFPVAADSATMEMQTLTEDLESRGDFPDEDTYDPTW